MKLVHIGKISIQTGHELRNGTVIHGSGTICEEYPDQKPDVSQCKGCRDDFYNLVNNSTTGQCWALESARVVDKVGYSNRNVMYGPDVVLRRTLSCWHGVY